MNRITHRTCSALLLTSTFLAPACGDLVASDDPGEPIAVVTGTLLSAEALDVQGELRLAILWGADRTNGYAVAGQVAELESSFPAGFRILLREPPPATALNTRETQRLAEVADTCTWHLDDELAEGDPATPAEVAECVERMTAAAEAGCVDVAADETGLCEDVARSLASTDKIFSATEAYAQGRLVAFDDRNGNGALDLIAPGTSELVDQIVWLDTDHMLSWREGEAVDGAPPPGFAVVSVRCPEGSAGADEGRMCPRWHGADEPLTLTLVPMALGPREHCAEVTGPEVERAGTIPAQSAANPPPAGGHCTENGLTYLLPSVCTPRIEGDLCGATVCESVVYYIEDPETPPANWPCEIPAE
jgi:hypothetical protein